GFGRDEPAAFRPARGRVGTRRGLHGRILVDALYVVHAWRVCRRGAVVRPWHGPIPGGLAAAISGAAPHLDSRRAMVHVEGLLLVFSSRHGQGHGAALPLRPAHAPRLEGVLAAVACHGGHRGGGLATVATRNLRGEPA